MPLRFQNRFVGAGEYKLQARVPDTNLNKIAALIMRGDKKNRSTSKEQGRFRAD